MAALVIATGFAIAMAGWSIILMGMLRRERERADREKKLAVDLYWRLDVESQRSTLMLDAVAQQKQALILPLLVIHQADDEEIKALYMKLRARRQDEAAYMK